MQSHPVARTFDIIKTKALMDKAEKTYVDLGEALGTTRQAVGHWFRGRGEPSVQQMKKIAEVLGVHWLELCTEETTVLFQQAERDHMNAWRELTPETRSLVEQIIAADKAKRE